MRKLTKRMCVAAASAAVAGRAVLGARSTAAKAFLQDTKAAAPQDTESGHIDWDAELADLLAET
ncbi:hypothetical protein [Peterkaempfera griseoplana]|uniref:hypothetical protein n=1 Tax=Peterkaempfera griseoplana TaxID=66896 RepID=UPI0006E160C3|nr:hypothetical protein [Peterkaempfera griseoplana]